MSGVCDSLFFSGKNNVLADIAYVFIDIGSHGSLYFNSIDKIKELAIPLCRSFYIMHQNNKLYIISKSPFLHQFDYFDLLSSQVIICRYVDVILYIEVYYSHCDEDEKRRLQKSRKLYLRWHSFHTFTLAMDEFVRVVIIWNKVFQMIICIAVCILSLPFIYWKWWFYVLRDIRRSKGF
jgi:hypothetical protein